MSTDLERLVVQLEAKMTNYERSMQRAGLVANRAAQRIENRFERANRNLSRGFQQMSRVATGALGAIGVAVGAAQLRQLMTDSLQAAEGIQDTADRVGFAVERLQELRLTADQNGASFQTLDMGLQRFQRRLGEAARGEGTLENEARELNIALRDQEGRMRDGYEILLDYADAIQQAESHQERLRLANQAFDSEGVALIEMMRLGRSGIIEYGEALQDAGKILESELVAKGAQANAIIRAMRDELTTAAQAEVLQYTDELVALSEALAEIAKWGIQAAAALGGVLQLGGFVSTDLRLAVTPEAAQEQAATARMLSERVNLIPGAARTDEIRDFLGRDFMVESLRRGMQQAADEGLAFRARNERAIEIQRELIARELDRLAETLSERADRLSQTQGARGGRGGDTPVSPGPAPALPAPVEVGRHPGVKAPQEGQAEPIEDLAARKAKAQVDAELSAYAENRDRFSSEYARTIVGGWMAAFDGRLADFAAQRLRDALYDKLFDLFQRLGGELFDSIDGKGGVLASGARFLFGGGKAEGGPVRAGYAYRVGERGPETIVPMQAGMVIPNQAPMRASSGGPVHVNNFHLHAEGAVMTDQLLQEMDMKAQAARVLAHADSRKDLADLQRRRNRSLRG